MNTPAARRETLVLVAGLVWTLVGLILMALGSRWLIGNYSSVIMSVCSGAAGGYLIHRFGFSHLARKNLLRIYSQSPQKDKICVFAFQNTRSYILIVIMMTMGYGLRHSGLPKTYLAPIYIAIGFALVLSSLLYYKRLRVAD